MAARFILASASPRRRELLARVGLHPEVAPTHVDESPTHAEEPAAEYVVRVAEAKARASGSKLAVLAADTVVALDGRPLGKPESPADAEAMLGRLSGRWHDVHTAVALRHAGRLRSVRVDTQVRFRSLDAIEIASYVETGEPLDKAGAYGIQGLGGALVAELRGSYTNVIGLPLEETLRLLNEEGLR